MKTLKSEQDALQGQVRYVTLTNKPVLDCTYYINYTPAAVGLPGRDKFNTEIDLQFLLERPGIEAKGVRLYRRGLFKGERDLCLKERVVVNKTASLELRLEHPYKLKGCIFTH